MAKRLDSNEPCEETSENSTAKVSNQKPVEIGDQTSIGTSSAWQTFVDGGFVLQGHDQVEQQEQLNQIVVKLNLYVDQSFTQSTSLGTAKGEMMVQSPNQRTSVTLESGNKNAVEIFVSSLLINGKVWVKLFREGAGCKDYFLFRATLAFRMGSGEDVQNFSKSYIDVMLPFPCLMDMRPIAELEHGVVKVKECVLSFSIEPISFTVKPTRLPVAEVNDQAGEDGEEKPADSFIGPENQSEKEPFGPQIEPVGVRRSPGSCNLQLSHQPFITPSDVAQISCNGFSSLFRVDEESSYSGISRDEEESVHSDVFDGAPYEEDDVSAIFLDVSAQMPFSETIVADPPNEIRSEHSEHCGSTLDQAVDYQDFASPLKDPEREAAMGYNQSVETSRAPSLVDEENEENHDEE